MAASMLASFARAATSLLTVQFETQLQSVRCRSMRASRRIRGYPRPLLDNVQRPEPHKYGWLPILPADGVYTTKKLPIRKLGGRDPVTGHVVVRTIGGGMKRYFRWIDHKRVANSDGTKLEERVYQVRYDPLRTARLALVASGDHRRWLTATEGIKPGDIITTSGDIPRIPVQPKDGDAHPLGALPVSTLVHHIERYPGEGGQMCRAAGTSAQILRKVEGRVIIQLPSKLQVSLNERCMAVVGQASNVKRLQTFYPIGSPNRLRRLGRRPRSGFWHRKDGYCGRKIRALPPVKVYPLQRPTMQ